MRYFSTAETVGVLLRKCCMTAVALLCVCFSARSQMTVTTEGADTAAGRLCAPQMRSLLFLGVPMSLSPEEFGAEIVARGLSASREDGCVYSGMFAGMEGCRVTFSFIGIRIYKVTVEFPRRRFWMDVKADYEHFKAMYGDVYGPPVECTERLAAKFREGSDLEKWGFESKYARWSSRFSCPGGDILLEVRFDPETENLYLAADYLDRIGMLYKDMTDKEDL